MSFDSRRYDVRLIAIFVVVLSLRVDAQVPIDQPCPNLGVVQHFDLHKYLGLWYEVESYPAVFAAASSCVTANYSLLPDGNVRVINRSFNTSSKAFDTVDGVARVVDAAKREAKLAVNFPGSAFNRPPKADGNYWVLDTDYVNFSIVWSCESFNGRSFQFLWHLNRQRSPPEAGVAFVRQRMDSFGLDRKFLKLTDQRNCPDVEDSRNVRRRAPTPARRPIYY